ncbi:cyclase family protein [Haloparvum sedimenti]|uniref:cyclase family protein n=1 Tax=Haloparvum sedimenti TaxID=1678448 RepID=UPI00071E8C1F|nr:cyclase family protein [Haloparvum sedimenti]
MYRDLSHPLRTGAPTYPGDPDVSVEPAATHEADGYSVHSVELGSHAGTHVDAPRHTEPDGATLDDGGVGEWVFDARLLDLTPCEAREGIEPAAFPDDLDPEIDLLVVRTGWANAWGTDAYRDHPFLTPAFAERCVDAGVGVGIDAFGPDPTAPAEPTDHEPGDEPTGFPAHHALLGADRPIVENLRNLAGLPDRFTVYAFPLPLAEGDGAPARVVAETR